VIHFDLNTCEIGKNFPITTGALADPRTALAMLAVELDRILTGQQREAARKRMDEAREIKSKRQSELRAADAARFGAVPLLLPEFMAQLQKRLEGLTPGPIVFDEALTHSAEVLRYLSFDEPGTYFQTRAGMLGTGLPGTVGLKAAHPDRLVLGFAGDGGSMQTIQALNVAARYRLGAKFIVCNNRSYRILKYNLQEYREGTPEANSAGFPEPFDLAASHLRFDELARGHGVEALRIEKQEEIGCALDRALADVNEPFLIDLVLSDALH
jgi:benzoylformate decarboxylase